MENLNFVKYTRKNPLDLHDWVPCVHEVKTCGCGAIEPGCNNCLSKSIFVPKEEGQTEEKSMVCKTIRIIDDIKKYYEPDSVLLPGETPKDETLYTTKEGNLVIYEYGKKIPFVLKLNDILNTLVISEDKGKTNNDDFSYGLGRLVNKETFIKYNISDFSEKELTIGYFGGHAVKSPLSLLSKPENIEGNYVYQVRRNADLFDKIKIEIRGKRRLHTARLVLGKYEIDLDVPDEELYEFVFNFDPIPLIGLQYKFISLYLNFAAETVVENVTIWYTYLNTNERCDIARNNIYFTVNGNTFITQNEEGNFLLKRIGI